MIIVNRQRMGRLEMNARASFAVRENAALVLAAGVFFSTVAYAAGPISPLPPQAPLVRAQAAAPVRAQPARPAARTPASFTPEMPLNEAIDILRNCTTPPLNIVVLWRDLDNAGIYRDTPIGIDGIPGLRVGRYLELLVLSLSAGAAAPVGYTVHRGVIIIGTTEALPASRYVTRVYDVRDLTAPPANYRLPPMGFGNMGFGGMGPGMYGGPMMGPGGYGGGFGQGYGMGPSQMPGGFYGPSGAGGFPGLTGNSYGPTRTGPSAPRGR